MRRRILDLEAALTMAAGHYAAGRLADAEQTYALAEAAAPSDLRAPYSRAVIAIRLGQWSGALRRLRKIVRMAPDHAGAHHNLGFVHQQLGAWPEAVAAYGRVVALDPSAAPARRNLAIALAASGRIDEAVAEYRTLAADPAEQVDGLTRLALLKPGAITDDEADRLRHLSVAPHMDEPARTGLMFALGEVLDARGQVDAAFQAYAQGNASKRRSLAASGAVPAAVARRNADAAHFLETRITAAFVAGHSSKAASRTAPIFIVGLPRSGSTLIEQILANHPHAQGMGESSVLSDLLAGQYPYGDAPHKPDHFRDLADAYLAAQAARGWDGRSRLVDKTPENYLHVGVIALMFPRASILHSQREAADVGFACFRQLFVAGNETLYDQAEIGAECVRVRDLMSHWSRVLPGKVTDVSYERLVGEPGVEIRSLVTEACGLPWDPACLDFQDSRRAVITASGAQVRRPIFTSSVQRWRPYAHHLQPLFAALGPYAPAI